MQSRRVQASPLTILQQYPTSVIVLTTRQHGCVFIEMDYDGDYEVYGFSIDQLRFKNESDVMKFCGDFTTIEILNQE